MTKVRKGLSRSSRPISPRSASFSMVLLYSFLRCAKKTNSAIINSLFSSAFTLNAECHNAVQESHANPNFVHISFFPSLSVKICLLNKGMTAQFYKKFSVIYSFINTISLQKKSLSSVLKHFFFLD